MTAYDPVGDVFKIEVGGEETNPLGLMGGQDPDAGVREGRIVAIGSRESLSSYGYNTYAFDKSLGDDDLLDKLHTYYSTWVGKMVSWPQMSESGTIIKEDDKQYAYVKWSAVTGKEKEIN
jgi:hypothetical protein